MSEVRILNNKNEIKKFSKMGWISNNIEINKDQLKALQEGKALCIFDGEQTTIIKVDNKINDWEMQCAIDDAEFKLIHGL